MLNLMGLQEIQQLMARKVAVNVSTKFKSERVELHNSDGEHLPGPGTVIDT